MKRDIIAEIKTNLDKSIEALVAERARQEECVAKATDGFVKIQKVEKANPFSGYSSDWINGVKRELTTRPYNYTDVPPTPEALEVEGLKRLADMKAAADALHVTNVPAMESNKKLIEKLTFLMELIEMPKSYSEQVYEKSRKRYGSDYTRVDRVAGYIGDISRFIITDDSYSAVAGAYASYTQELKNHCQKMRDEASAAKQKKDMEAKGTVEQQRALAEAAAEVERLKKQLAAANNILGE